MIYFNEPALQGKATEKLDFFGKSNYNHYMGLENIDDQFYSGDPYEQIGRHIPAGGGAVEVIVCDKLVWDYIDWLIERGATSMESIMAVLDEYRKDHDVSALLADYIYQSAEHRSEMGLPQPDWLLT